YAVLCAIAVEILLNSSGAGSGHANKTTAGVLGWPAGTWFVGIAGVVLIAVALYQGYRGFTRDFLKDSKTEEMSSAVKAWIKWIGTFGHLSRMVVFGHARMPAYACALRPCLAVAHRTPTTKAIMNRVLSRHSEPRESPSTRAPA